MDTPAIQPPKYPNFRDDAPGTTFCAGCGTRIKAGEATPIRAGLIYHTACAPPARRYPQRAVARKGEDWWTADEAENGWVPSDATWADEDKR
jgi:hypothetical protein